MPSPSELQEAKEEKARADLAVRTTRRITDALGITASESACARYGGHLPPHPGSNSAACLRCGRSASSRIM